MEWFAGCPAPTVRVPSLRVPSSALKMHARQRVDFSPVWPSDRRDRLYTLRVELATCAGEWEARIASVTEYLGLLQAVHPELGIRFHWADDVQGVDVQGEELRVRFALALYLLDKDLPAALEHAARVQDLALAGAAGLPAAAALYLDGLVKACAALQVYATLLERTARSKDDATQNTERMLATVLHTALEQHWRPLHAQSSGKEHALQPVASAAVTLPEVVRPLRHLVYAQALAVECLVEWHVARAICADPAKAVAAFFPELAPFAGATYVGVTLSRFERCEGRLSRALNEANTRAKTARVMALTHAWGSDRKRALALAEVTTLESLHRDMIGPVCSKLQLFNRTVANEPRPSHALALALDAIDLARHMARPRASAATSDSLIERLTQFGEKRRQLGETLPPPARQWLSTREEAMMFILRSDASPALRESVRRTIEDEAVPFYKSLVY